MLSSAGPIDTAGRMQPSVQSQSAQASAWAPVVDATAAVDNSAAAITFPADTVQVSAEAMDLKQSAQQSGDSSKSGGPQKSADGGGVDVARVRETIADLQKSTTAVTFDLSEDPGHVVVKIVDSATGEVVRQIPSEEMLKLAQRQEALRGMLLRKTS